MNPVELIYAGTRASVHDTAIHVYVQGEQKFLYDNKLNGSARIGAVISVTFAEDSPGGVYKTGPSAPTFLRMLDGADERLPEWKMLNAAAVMRIHNARLARKAERDTPNDLGSLTLAQIKDQLTKLRFPNAQRELYVSVLNYLRH